MSLSIDSSKQGEKEMLFRVQGEIDQHSYEALDEALTQATEDGFVKIRLDLSKVAYISSAGLGVLAGCAGRVASEEGGALELVAPSPAVQNVMDSMGFSGFFTILTASAACAVEGVPRAVAQG